MLAKSSVTRLLMHGLMVASLSGCQTLGYYQQLASGQWQMLRARTPVAEMLRDPATPQELAQQLRKSEAMLQFAEDVLLLPAKNQYRSYVDLGRPQAVWALFATPEFSLEPKQWCYPLIGCAHYRGYFSLSDARRLEHALQQRGFDTLLRPVSAYSTLGWFHDPLLNTFLMRPEPELAALLFHELAHQRLYVADDSAFNESFASVVAETGVTRWLTDRRKPAALARHRRQQERERTVLAILDRTRQRLCRLYQAEQPESRMRVRKESILSAAAADLDMLARTDPAYRGYRQLFAGLNNAGLVAMRTYDAYVPALRRELVAADDLSDFYRRVARLGHLSPTERRARLLGPGHRHAGACGPTPVAR